MQNCFVGLVIKSAYQNLKIDLELYLGMFRSNKEGFEVFLTLLTVHKQ